MQSLHGFFIAGISRNLSEIFKNQRVSYKPSRETPRKSLVYIKKWKWYKASSNRRSERFGAIGNGYGYFGKGSTSYTHYMLMHERNFDSGGGECSPGCMSGCLCMVAALTLTVMAIGALLV